MGSNCGGIKYVYGVSSHKVGWAGVPTATEAIVGNIVLYRGGFLWEISSENNAWKALSSLNSYLQLVAEV